MARPAQVVVGVFVLMGAVAVVAEEPPSTLPRSLAAMDAAGNGDGTGRVKRLLALNTALFFTRIFGKGRRCAIGTLEWIDGWTLERKMDPQLGPDCN